MFVEADGHTHLIFAFHQNYPEFHTEDKVKEVYEILKSAPNFKSKIMQIENMTDIISVGCLNLLRSPETSENENVDSSLEICDEEVTAMMVECDEHFNVMEYCRDKINFMTDYVSERNLNQESSGKIASLSPN
jgi:hypothetical protein